MIMQLNKTILSLQKTIEDMNAREAAVLQENQVLKEQIDYLTKKLFGKSSEKNVCDIERQMTLFNELEKEQDPSLLEQEEEEAKTVSFTVRKGRSKKRRSLCRAPCFEKVSGYPGRRTEMIRLFCTNILLPVQLK